MAFLLRILAAAILCVSFSQSSLRAAETWVVYYGHTLPSETFLPFDLVLFDSEKHPPLRPLRNRGKVLLGYISAGEIEDYRGDFETLKAKGLPLVENKSWPGHYIVDIRKPVWAKYIIEEKIPPLLHTRFDGIMLDTLDSPIYLEEKYPKKFKGMKQAAIDLIRAIRMHYPGIKIMVNRAFPALLEMAPYIDMLLAESIMVNYQPDKKEEVTLFDDYIYKEYLALIKEAKEIAPQLKVYSLDYVHSEDVQQVKEIYRMQRENNLIPYVSTIDLQRVIKEPAR